MDVLIQNNVNQADDSYNSNNSTYKSSSYLSISIAILGFVLGILTVIKFRKYLKQNTWSKLRASQERTLIIQVYFKEVAYRVTEIVRVAYGATGSRMVGSDQYGSVRFNLGTHI